MTRKPSNSMVRGVSALLPPGSIVGRARGKAGGAAQILDPTELRAILGVSVAEDLVRARDSALALTASTTEQLQGTTAVKLSTPDSVAALWEKGGDVASAATVTFGEGGYFHITGTTTITALAFTTDKAGRRVFVRFSGALTLTHNATSLFLPNDGNDIVTAANDTALFVSEGSGNFRCLAYVRADGTALVETASASWVPSVDGAEPPGFITDGAGNLIFVAYGP